MSVLTLNYITNQYGPLPTVRAISCKDKDIIDVDDLSECIQLMRLDISHNRFTSIQHIITASSLTQLNISHNHISSIKHISHLANLIVLNISYNRIEHIETIITLTSLKCLIANNNNIKTLVPSSSSPSLSSLASTITPASNHSCLPASLQTLVLSHNQLTSVNGIFHLSAVTKLSLSYNQLSNLLDQFHSLIELTELRVNNNNLSTIPTSLSHCQRLKLVDLGSNHITSLNALSPLISLPYLRNLQLKGNGLPREKNDNNINNVASSSYTQQIRKMFPLLAVLDSNKLKKQRSKSPSSQNQTQKERQWDTRDVDFSDNNADIDMATDNDNVLETRSAKSNRKRVRDDREGLPERLAKMAPSIVEDHVRNDNEDEDDNDADHGDNNAHSTYPNNNNNNNDNNNNGDASKKRRTRRGGGRGSKIKIPATTSQDNNDERQTSNNTETAATQNANSTNKQQSRRSPRPSLDSHINTTRGAASASPAAAEMKSARDRNQLVRPHLSSSSSSMNDIDDSVVDFSTLVQSAQRKQNKSPISIPLSSPNNRVGVDDATNNKMSLLDEISAQSQHLQQIGRGTGVSAWDFEE